MKTSHVALFAAAVAILGGPAFAQQTPESIPTPTGAQVPGICMMSSEALYTGSQLGQFIELRINQIGAQSIAELNEGGSALDADRLNLRSRIEAQGEAALESEVAAFNQRVQQYLQLREVRAAEVERTRQLAQQRFGDEARPVLIQVSQSRQCAFVMEMDTLIIPDPRADITRDVVTALNAKISQFSIEKAVMPLTPPGQ